MTLGFTRHAMTKMRGLGVTVDDVLRIIARHDVIERYQDRDGALLHGWIGRTEVHVSLVRGAAPPVTLVVTVYEVAREEFPDGRTRRSRP